MAQNNVVAVVQVDRVVSDPGAEDAVVVGVGLELVDHREPLGVRGRAIDIRPVQLLGERLERLTT